MTVNDSFAGNGGTVPRRVRLEAAASLFSVICTLFATGRDAAARYLADGLSDELRRELNELMEYQLPLMLLARWNGQVPSEPPAPSPAAADEAVPPSTVRQPREPEWRQRIETALHEVLGDDRDLVATITRDFHYDLLVRLVRERAEDEGVEATDVLRRLGDLNLSLVALEDDPTRYLIVKVNTWTPDTDPDVL